MGTWNYGKSDYVTLAANFNYSDYENDEEFMNVLKEEVKEYGGTVDEAIQRYIDSDYMYLYEEVESILKNYSLCYFDLHLEYGYYEGFQLMIEPQLPILFDDWKQRKEANKEVTEIKECLLKCLSAGMKVCHLGWVMGWSDFKESKREVNNGIKKMREEIKSIMTENIFDRLNDEQQNLYFRNL